MNTFKKIIVIIVLLLAPMIALYSYSNQVSTTVVKEQLIQSNLNRLSLFLEQFDSVSEQLWRSAYMTMQNPNTHRLQSKQQTIRSYESLHWRVQLEDDLKQLSNSLPWGMELTLFAPNTGIVISISSKNEFDLAYFQSQYSRNWTYQDDYFVRHITRPFTLDDDITGMDLVLEAAIPARQIASYLQHFKSGTSSEPILYAPGMAPITSTDADVDLIAEAIHELRGRNLNSEGHDIIKIGQRSYLMSYSESKSFGWHLIDFVPLETIMQPIRFNMYLFYSTIALLLLIGIACAGFIYRHVQLPIYQLTKGVQHLRRGEYAYRVNEKSNDEFSYLFSEFNAMSKEIQQLIEKVYFEQINVRDARLKQLQSQINPHFLYNNFNFIQSMAEMDNKEAVIAFTQHLSSYYRYVTRQENSFTPLESELALVKSYLEIHAMQMDRLTYRIDVPDSMLSLPLPRLTLQPIVENAIIHGIENRLGQGFIHITGKKTAEGYLLAVEDNGIGMSEEQISQLEHTLNQRTDAGSGRGLHNVHQRLKHAFDPRAGITMKRADSGGLLVTIHLIGNVRKIAEEEGYVQSAHRG